MKLEEIQKHIANYRSAWKTGTPVGGVANNQVRVFTIVHCAETDQQAMEQGGGEAALWYIDYILNRMLARERALEDPNGPRPYSQFLDRLTYLKGHAEGSLRADVFDEQSMIITGNPDTCIRKI